MRAVAGDVKSKAPSTADDVEAAGSDVQGQAGSVLDQVKGALGNDAADAKCSATDIREKAKAEVDNAVN